MSLLNEIEDYVLFHLKKRVWDRCTEKEACLATAERILARLPLIDDLPDPLTQDFKDALFEMAIAFADGIDTDKEYRLLSRSTHGYGPLRQQKNTLLTEEYLAIGIPCYEAWRILSPYINKTKRVDLERIS